MFGRYTEAVKDQQNGELAALLYFMNIAPK